MSKLDALEENVKLLRLIIAFLSAAFLLLGSGLVHYIFNRGENIDVYVLSGLSVECVIGAAIAFVARTLYTSVKSIRKLKS